MTQLAGVLAALAVVAACACAAVALGMILAAIRQRDERATGCAIAAAALGMFWAAVGLLAVQLFH